MAARMMYALSFLAGFVSCYGVLCLVAWIGGQTGE
jgi:hypothetical protein